MIKMIIKINTRLIINQKKKTTPKSIYKIENNFISVYCN